MDKKLNARAFLNAPIKLFKVKGALINKELRRKTLVEVWGKVSEGDKSEI